jgi:hypothetical protein
VEIATAGDDAGKVTARTPLPGRPVGVAASTDGAWVATRDGVLLRVAHGGGVVARAEAGAGLPAWEPAPHPQDVALGEGSLWLVLDNGTVERLDAETGRSLGTIDVGANAVAVAVGGGAVWVAVRGGSALGDVRGRFRVLPSSGGPPDATCARSTRCRLQLAVELESAAGISALLEADIREHRRPGGAIRCRGKLYEAPATADVHSPGVARMRIERYGTMAVRFDRLVAAAETVEVAPNVLCATITGAWTGIAGGIVGTSGRFEWQLSRGSEVIVIR